MRIDVGDGGLAATGGMLALQPDATRACVLLHPHPARGGDMHNALIAQAVRLLRAQGITSLRFNMSVPDAFYHSSEDPMVLLDHNVAELHAAVQLLTAHTASRAARHAAPKSASHAAGHAALHTSDDGPISDGVPIVLCGYSWGALVALASARRSPASVRAIALIAPPIDVVPPPMHPSRGDFARWPVLLAVGDTDEYCSVAKLQEIARGQATTLVTMPATGHFLQGASAETAALHMAEWIATLDLQ